MTNSENKIPRRNVTTVWCKKVCVHCSPCHLIISVSALYY